MATAAEEQISPPVIHPLIRTHPANGRKSLYIGFHASHIDGMDEEKGWVKLFHLLDFATQDRFVYAHIWRAGDLVVWDNPSLVHKSFHEVQGAAASTPHLRAWLSSALAERIVVSLVSNWRVSRKGRNVIRETHFQSTF